MGDEGDGFWSRRRVVGTNGTQEDARGDEWRGLVNLLISVDLARRFFEFRIRASSWNSIRSPFNLRAHPSSLLEPGEGKKSNRSVGLSAFLHEEW